MYLLFYIVQFWRVWYQNVFQQDDEYSSTQSGPGCDDIFETLEHNPSVNSWLPPIPINTSKFKCFGTNVDNHGTIYFHYLENGMKNKKNITTNNLFYFHEYCDSRHSSIIAKCFGRIKQYIYTQQTRTSQFQMECTTDGYW